MSVHETNSSVLSNISSRAHKTRRRTALGILLDEEAVFSESDDEVEFYPSSSVQGNTEPNISTKLVTDQVLMLGCGHCMCCKKINEFFKLLPMTEKSTRSSSSTNYDSGQEPSCSQECTKGKKIVNEQGHPLQKINIISHKTLIFSKKWKEVDNSDKYFNFGVPDTAGNACFETFNSYDNGTKDNSTTESCNNIGLSTTDQVSNQYCDVSNTDVSFGKTHDEKPETNIFPSARSKIIPQQLENSVQGRKRGEIKKKSKILLDSGKKRRPNNSINSNAHSSTDALEIENKNETDGKSNFTIINATMNAVNPDLQLNGQTTKAKVRKFRFESSSSDSQKENKSFKEVLGNEISVSTKKKQRDRQRKTAINEIMDGSSSDNQNVQAGFSAGKMKRKSKLNIHSKHKDTTDLQLNGNSTKSKIKNFKFESSSPDSQKENESYKEDLDNERPVSTEKKQRDRRRKSTTNEVINSSSSGNQNEQADFSAGKKKRRGRPKKKRLDFAISQNTRLINEKILKEEKILESIKKRQRGRPKKLQCINDNEIQLGSSATYGYSSLDQNNDNITPTKDCELRRSRPHKPVITFLAETDPYNLKNKIRRKKKPGNIEIMDCHWVRTPLLNLPLDTTLNRSFSKAATRKLGRTGGISFDMDSLSVADGHFRSFDTQKSRTLYTSDEWLNSEEFLRLSGDEY